MKYTFKTPSEMTVSLSSPLPPLYAAWVEDLLGGSIPPETRATCHDCAMCEDGADYQAPDSKFFNPVTKCCTYLPEISNFLTGQILADDDPAITKGRASIEARINAGVAVTPLGLGRNQRYALLYDNMDVQVFGRAQSLRCPHYIDEQGGLCGIWKYRNSVCSTWFCRHVRGVAGESFGKRRNTCSERSSAIWRSGVFPDSKSANRPWAYSSNSVALGNPNELTWIRSKTMQPRKSNDSYGETGLAASRNSIASALGL
jgi:hypothetical protein